MTEIFFVSQTFSTSVESAIILSVIMRTVEAILERYNASVKAVFPPPIIATSFPLYRGPSQIAQ